jgi:nicotinamide phosphoribosyltransferase
MGSIVAAITALPVRTCKACNGEGTIAVEKPIFKDPKTDDGTKKSMKGKVMVFNGHDNLPSKGIWARDGYKLDDESPWDLLHTIYLNGKLMREQTFSQIRAKLNG